MFKKIGDCLRLEQMKQLILSFFKFFSFLLQVGKEKLQELCSEPIVLPTTILMTTSVKLEMVHDFRIVYVVADVFDDVRKIVPWDVFNRTMPET